MRPREFAHHAGRDAAAEPLIAYVSGETPPDFAAIAICGFTVVLLDSAASWCADAIVAEARAYGLTAVVFRMGYAGSSHGG